jgi:hypothetical protein
MNSSSRPPAPAPFIDTDEEDKSMGSWKVNEFESVVGRMVVNENDENDHENDESGGRGRRRGGGVDTDETRRKTTEKKKKNDSDGEIGDKKMEKEDDSLVSSTTATKTGISNDDSNSLAITESIEDNGKQPPPPHLTGKKNLNEPTLNAVQTYLLGGDFLNEPLEYEELTTFDLKIHRYTDERTRMRQGLLYSNNTNPGDVIDDVDTADERFYDQVYDEEEFHAVAVDFTKSVAAEASDRAGSSFIMHTKTYNWLKKAAGLHRAYDPYGPPQTQPLPQYQLFVPIDQRQHNRPNSQPHNPTSNNNGTSPYDSDDGEALEASPGMAGGKNDGAPASRFARPRVRMTRKRRRQERIDKDTAGLRILSEVVQELISELNSRCMESKGKGRSKNRTAPSSSSTPLPVILDTDKGGGNNMDKVSLETHDFVGRSKTNVPVPDKPLFPTLQTKDLLCIESLNVFNDPLSLSMMNWIERPSMGEIEVTSTQDIQYAGHDKEIPPALTKLGLEFRPRPLTIETKEVRSRKDIYMGKYQSKDVYASNCKMMLNALHTGARDWAIHEFFYSTIDRDWYRHDGFAADLARLKLPITSSSKLTRTEWSLIRRKVRGRPRLFSKRFIVEQIRRRNRYRSLIRQLQQDPTIPEFSTIPKGSVVTAYNKRFRTILKGKILLYDPRTHEYLVQFERQKYGYELCPDFEVACTGKQGYVPSPLFEPSPFLSYDEPRRTELVLADENGEPKTDLTDVDLEEIEREVLLRLVTTIKEAFDRKTLILTAVQLCAEAHDTSKGKEVMWLTANLNETNESIEAAMLHLQVMYGELYKRSEALKQALPKEVTHDPSFTEWLESLREVSTILGGAVDGISTDRSECLQQQNSSSTWVGMLLLVNYLTEFFSFADDQQNKSTLSNGALDTALKNAFDQFANTVLPSKMENELSDLELENESRIEKALMELGSAVGMLRAEVAVGWGKDGTVTPEILTI